MVKGKGKITIKPFVDKNNPNMGLSKYNMVVFDGCYQEESIAYLDPTNTGKRRYLTGLNEFAPEVERLNEDDKALKIKQIREDVARIERYFGNDIDVKDKDFWAKVRVSRPDNYEFWEKITIKLGNDPIYLDPDNDIYDLIKLRAIEAGGFSLIAPSLRDAQTRSSKGIKYYLDRYEDTISMLISYKKLRNNALALLNQMYHKNPNKLFYVAKVVSPTPVKYRKTTPLDVLYDDMDAFINGETVDREKTKSAQKFIEAAELDIDILKLKALLVDAIYYKIVSVKADGNIYHNGSGVFLGKTVTEAMKSLSDPTNETILADVMQNVEKFWNEY